MASTTTLAPTSAAGSTVMAAANATQRSCWRSTPRARRKRTTSDQTPTAKPPAAMANATAIAATTAPARAGTVNRSMTDW